MNLIPYVFILRAEWLRAWLGCHVNRDNVHVFLISIALYTYIRIYKTVTWQAIV